VDSTFPLSEGRAAERLVVRDEPVVGLTGGVPGEADAHRVAVGGIEHVGQEEPALAGAVPRLDVVGRELRDAL